MSEELRAANGASESLVAIRQAGNRRLLSERRQEPRLTPERRVTDRRRAARIARAGLLALLAIALPKKEGSALATPGLVEVITTDFRLATTSPEHMDDIIAAAAERYGVRPDLIRAVIKVESGFNPLAVSRVGALGLMQLMPHTARQLGVEDPFDAKQNVFAGAKYLSMLLDRFKGDVALAVASYNAGPNAVGRYRGRIPPFRETRGYVRKVRDAQDYWIRESGDSSLAPFEIRPAMLQVAKTARRGRGHPVTTSLGSHHRTPVVRAASTKALRSSHKAGKSRRASRRRGGLRA